VKLKKDSNKIMEEKEQQQQRTQRDRERNDNSGRSERIRVHALKAIR
jgi:hypothetical protein